MAQDLSMYMEFKFSLGSLVNAGIFMRHGYSRGPRTPNVIWIGAKGCACTQNRRGILKMALRIYVEGVRMGLSIHPET
jgi:hypothetical protein